MNDTIKNVFIFVTGAAVGSVVTWKLLRDKYAKIAQEEIDSVKERFSVQKRESSEDAVEHHVDVEPQEDNSVIDEYNEQVKKYTSNASKEENKEEIMDKPYVITPEDFGEKDDYECFTLKYYSDDVITDTDDIIVDDVENVIGTDIRSHYGEYEEDCVYVRNDRLKHDYEVLYVIEKYSDVLKRKPYLKEG